ncbi:N-acetylmuramoyl-L-alanine amidase [Gloeomargarita lithophora Alchichica-D10]|uniref:N-acetylmuramoyl-L-alanine amidase n=1 Tax=Gloeomargarita lithophora Alchichica-D10 TaxID=1188229 RepID=A0A1J0AH15_9CYAN|nr:N-acetylmuramoyl-L-alanine amidase [Gloeomargarita lithophora]APB35236.1 N-acetylmuramoyl-L-alanine amidase [Gloeomargarita lithophora Alchichica-D10]
MGIVGASIACISCVTVATPVWARATLQAWQYDPQGQRLEFRTDRPTQPQVQVIGAQRVVIDLPDTRWPQPQSQQNFGTTQVRVAQYQPDVARLVLAVPEAINPAQVRLQPQGHQGWTVVWGTATQAKTMLQAAQWQSPGILLRLSTPGVVGRVLRSKDKQWLYIDLPNTAVSGSFQNQTRPYNLRVEPGLTGNLRLALEVKTSDPDWQLRATPQGLLLARPTSAPSIARTTPPSRPKTTTPKSIPPTATRPSSPPPRTANKTRYTVLIDPGHGGPDPGAIGRGGIQEKEIVLDISRRVARLLEAQGVRAVLSRTQDVDLDLEPRVALAERVNATLFVSIHANAISMSRPEVNGLETYYYQNGQWLARSIHQNLRQTTNAPDRGVRQARFYVLRRSSMRATLVEVGYVTGAQDAPRLASSSYRQKVAQGIAQGIIRYLDNLAKK